MHSRPCIRGRTQFTASSLPIPKHPPSCKGRTAAKNGDRIKRTRSISSVGDASFLSDSSSFSAFSGGSLAATTLVSAFTRDSSSRWSMPGIAEILGSENDSKADDDDSKEEKTRNSSAFRD